MRRPYQASAPIPIQVKNLRLANAGALSRSRPPQLVPERSAHSDVRYCWSARSACQSSMMRLRCSVVRDPPACLGLQRIQSLQDHSPCLQIKAARSWFAVPTVSAAVFVIVADFYEPPPELKIRDQVVIATLNQPFRRPIATNHRTSPTPESSSRARLIFKVPNGRAFTATILVQSSKRPPGNAPWAVQSRKRFPNVECIKINNRSEQFRASKSFPLCLVKFPARTPRP